MKTTLLTRVRARPAAPPEPSASSPSPAPPASPATSGRPPWRSIRAAATTCSTISAVDMLRVRPSCPVAQNGQFIPQPAWLEMHTVTRFG